MNLMIYDPSLVSFIWEVRLSKENVSPVLLQIRLARFDFLVPKHRQPFDTDKTRGRSHDIDKFSLKLISLKSERVILLTRKSYKSWHSRYNAPTESPGSIWHELMPRAEESTLTQIPIKTQMFSSGQEQPHSNVIQFA